ncbi:MAG: hypothetical protein Q9159_002741 [Coniocarpon cinnabarinum]
MATISNTNHENDTKSTTEKQEEALNYVHLILATVQRERYLDFVMNRFHYDDVWDKGMSAMGTPEGAWYRDYRWRLDLKVDSEIFEALGACWRGWWREVRGSGSVIMALPSDIHSKRNKNEQQQEALNYVHRILTTLQRAWRLEYDASKAHGINCIYADARHAGRALLVPDPIRTSRERDERSTTETQQAALDYVHRILSTSEERWDLEFKANTASTTRCIYEDLDFPVSSTLQERCWCRFQARFEQLRFDFKTFYEIERVGRQWRWELREDRKGRLAVLVFLELDGRHMESNHMATPVTNPASATKSYTEKQQEVLNYVHRILSSFETEWDLDFKASRAFATRCAHEATHPPTIEHETTHDERRWYRSQAQYLERARLDFDTFFAIEEVWRYWRRELREGERKVGLAALGFLNLEVEGEGGVEGGSSDGWLVMKGLSAA